MNWVARKSIGWIIILILLSGCSNSESGNIGQIEKLDSALSIIIDEKAKIKIIVEGFDWCEGPLWLEESKTLLFSDVPKNIIHLWSEEAGLKKYLTPSGYTGSQPRAGEMGSNGLALSLDNKLLVCQHGDRRVAMMDASLKAPNPRFITLANNIGGKRFNSPIDLTIYGTMVTYILQIHRTDCWALTAIQRRKPLSAEFTKSPREKFRFLWIQSQSPMALPFCSTIKRSSWGIQMLKNQFGMLLILMNGIQ